MDLPEGIWVKIVLELVNRDVEETSNMYNFSIMFSLLRQGK